MRKTVLSVFISFLSILVVVSTAHSKGLPSNYAVLKAGGFFPAGSDLDDIDADTGFHGEVAFGHYVAPGFAVEGGVGYFETEGTLSAAGASREEKFEIIPLTLSLRGQVPYGRYEPYGFIGLGAYFVEDKISGSVPALGVSGSSSDDDTSLGFHIGIGGNYTLMNNLFVGVEVRYLYLETSTFDVDFTIGGVTLTGNVGYRF